MPEVVVSIPDPTNSEIQYYSVVRITGLENTDASARYESGTGVFQFYKTATEKAMLASKGMRAYADAVGSTTYVEIKSPTSLSASYTVRMPSSAPAANQVMLSDVSGNLSWVTGGVVASASGTANSLVIFNSSGQLADAGLLTDGQLFVGRTGLAPIAASLTGTANQVNVATGAGSITLSLPQSVAAASSPTFAGLTLTSFSGVVKAVAGVLSAATIVNADVSASAAIAYSKLNLSLSIVNADIAVAAAIARSKLASGTASHVLINDGTGVMSSEAQLAVSRGGTGLASYTTGALLFASGASTLAALAIGTEGTILKVVAGALAWASAGSADVTGPASATDNALARFDLTTGKLIQNSTAILSDTGALSGITTLNTTDVATLGAVGFLGTHTAYGDNFTLRSAALRSPQFTLMQDATTRIGIYYDHTNSRPYIFSNAQALHFSADAAATSAGNIAPTTNKWAIGAPAGTQVHDVNGGLALTTSATIGTTLGVTGAVTLTAQTASRVLTTDGSKVVTSSAVTTTELGYLTGVTSAIQTQFGTKVTGPASATDNAIAVFDGTTGKLVKNSKVTLDASTGALSISDGTAAVQNFINSGGVSSSTVFAIKDGASQTIGMGLNHAADQFITGTAAGTTGIRTLGRKMYFSTDAGAAEIGGFLDTTSSWEWGKAGYTGSHLANCALFNIRGAATADPQLSFQQSTNTRGYIYYSNTAGKLILGRTTDSILISAGGLVEFGSASSASTGIKILGNDSGYTTSTLKYYMEGTTTVTLSGITTVVTGTAKWTRIGNKVTLRLPALSGTSNTGSCAMTGLPAFITPSTNQSFWAHVRDNGVSSFGQAIVASTGQVDFYHNAGFSAWTSSGTKSIPYEFTITYIVD